jgi:hypothetical protein
MKLCRDCKYLHVYKPLSWADLPESKTRTHLERQALEIATHDGICTHENARNLVTGEFRARAYDRRYRGSTCGLAGHEWEEKLDTPARDP